MPGWRVTVSLLACLAVWLGCAGESQSGQAPEGGAPACAVDQPEQGPVLANELRAVGAILAFDPGTKQMVALDLLMRKQAGIGVPNDFASEACLAVFGSGYLFDTARLVPDGYGRYLTISDARRQAQDARARFNTDALNKAGEACSMMQEACRRNDGTSFNTACGDFASAVQVLQTPRPPGALLALWSGADTGATAAVTVFRDSFRALADFFGSAGISRSASELAATFLLSSVCLLMLVLAWSVPRITLRRRLARIRREVEAIRGKTLSLKATTHAPARAMGARGAAPGRAEQCRGAERRLKRARRLPCSRRGWFNPRPRAPTASGSFAPAAALRPEAPPFQPP